MRRFEPYITDIEDLAKQVLAGADMSAHIARFEAILNGGPSAALEQTLSLKARRRMGAFFTGRELRQGLFSLPGLAESFLGAWDPTCGAGDLLLEASTFLDVDRKLESTLHTWARCLSGTDIEPAFVRVARARLIIAAYSRGSRPTKPLPPTLDDYFPLVRAGNTLSVSVPRTGISHIVLNPPFGSTRAPSSCAWAHGTVSRAAIFLDHCISSSPAGTRIAAILPDVLRTGSRYRAWRAWVDSRVLIDAIRVCGQFNKSAEVDVFAAYITIRSEINPATSRDGTSWAQHTRTKSGTLADRFDIHVGTVVPHRDPEEGPVRSFLHARSAPHSAEICRIRERRCFAGRVFTPPFIALHRTSSPYDKVRPVFSLVLGKRPVAVENHLIVLSPKDGRLSECRRALAILGDVRTTRFLDQRIRCRHLTLDAVGEIPWIVAPE